MSVKTFSISLSTRGNTDVHDLTSELARLVRESGFKSGLLTVFCPSSTSGVTTVEYEPGAISDLKRMFEELIPSNRPYAHNATWEDHNGHSHMRASLLGPSLTIPIVNGRLTLGTWQQVIYVDFDIRPRRRELVVQMVGEE
ncbi:MAG: secondary thiamine-phosphate synthase enzyme YjbQ [Anaerolineales bacterium]|nr:secondary thiamine-phosphate synthase enzyme YjbQ [Anaerolineales bacterium]MDW8227930.1 secondary thiamine-phosphate synthase enzyme YjbQ [Anaerolineales bacterium]